MLRQHRDLFSFIPGSHSVSAAGVRRPWHGSSGSGEGAGWAASVADKIDDEPGANEPAFN